MAIPIKREPEDLGMLHERCCFCWKPTPFWYEKKDVAVCEDCAKTHTVDEVPTKKDWCAEFRKRFPRFGH